jgi:Protein of unknown function (DUF1579)
MSIPVTLGALVGEWEGRNLLWLSPDDPARESATSATVSLAAQGRFLTVSYRWADGGKPQDGVILLGAGQQGKTLEAAWVDSFHMGDALMPCTVVVESNGGVSLVGSYAAPPGPDWGWRIEIQPDAADGSWLRMYNITPDGEEALAVEASYSRQPLDAPGK